VVVEVRLQATLGHGGHYDNDYCFIFELEAGLIKRVREYMDTQRGAAWFRSSSAADGKHHPGGCGLGQRGGVLVDELGSPRR
jgi:hypothetical protein